MQRACIFGINVDRVTFDQAVSWALEAIKKREPSVIITLNPEMIQRTQYDPEFIEVLRQANLVVADGVGVVWACRMLRSPVPERVAGTDTMLEIISRGSKSGLRVFLLGSRPGIADKAAAVLVKRHPGIDIVGTHHGYFTPGDEQALIERINTARPDVLFVGIGGAKGEKWIVRHRRELDVPLAMGVGGSLDVVAGAVRRAPVWMQKASIEWLFRLINEPSRWRRQMMLPAFALRVLGQRLRGGNSGDVWGRSN